MALARLEANEAAGLELDLLGAGADLDAAVDDHDPRVLLHLVVAERLAGVDRDEHGASAFVLMDDRRVARSAGRLDRPQVPVLHAGIVTQGAN